MLLMNGSSSIQCAHFSVVSLGNGASQVNFWSRSDCSNIFATIVAGAIQPSGSKMLAMRESTLLFVTGVGIV